MNLRAYARSLSFLVAAFLVFGSVAAPFAHADDTSDIQDQIDDHNDKIKALEDEIAAYQKQLDVLGVQHQTLQSTIKTIDVSRAQTTSQLKVTQNRISASNLKLQELSGQITEKEYEIALDRQALGQSLRDMADADQVSIPEQVFSSDDFSDMWASVDANMSLNDALRERTGVLQGAKEDLSVQKDSEAKTKDQLTELTSKLANEKKQLDIAIAEKNRLLDQTKSQESSYQMLITQKRAEQAQFEAELFTLSQQLKSVGKGGLPPAASGILHWPLETIRVTQYFGKTTDSGRLYSSGTHNGVDFAAAIGTPVHAALSGVVFATNEGAVQNCQYGKWVLVKHANGLATLYAHLSEIVVSDGQTVATGDVVGYSGMTGYATGPHLHLSVFVAAAVTLQQYTCKSGYTVTIPNANPSDYLDPMVYL